MGSNSSSGGGGRTDAGKNRTTAQKYTAPPSKAIGVDKFGNTITSRTSNSANIYGTDDPDTMSQASSTGSVSGDSDRGGGNDYSDSPTPTTQPASFRSINPDRTPAPKSILSRIGDYIKGGGLIGMGLTYLQNQYAKDKIKREANVE